MKPLTPIGSPSPLRLLNKGPDYLRRQIDGGGNGRSISAVERLEADKAKYVKSQQVINTKQEPVLVPCATPPPQDENENDDSRKENRRTSVDVEAHNRTPHSAPVLRRSTGKRMLRPDSLVMYRQKKECKSPSGAPEGENNNSEVKGYSFVRRLFQGSMREKSSVGEGRIQKMVIGEEKAPPRDGESRMSWTNEKDTTDGGLGSRSPPMIRMTLEAGITSTSTQKAVWELQRSKSDLHLRCSVALSEQDIFFDYCGLDMDMIERLGRENFLSGASSIDTLSLALRSVVGDGCGGSEPSEFSRHSGDGLFQEELADQIPTGVSIIERNARVIKWLYGFAKSPEMLQNFC
uniref:Family with sequence similarity 110 member D n=1 Tax=Labrus bergylta TaxID=56723 RepID=A0A3Q3LMX8_9LABR